MDTRRVSRHRSPSPIINERLITKKEIEECPQRFKPCPVVPKKSVGRHSDYLHKAATAFKREGKTVKPLYYNNRSTLSKLYNPNINTNYLSQVYHVYDSIGEGSFGIVYKVRSKEDNKCYAIKVMKKYNSYIKNSEEIRRLEKIGDHKNIIKFYFAWQENSCIYLQLELCALSLSTYTKTNHDIHLNQLWDIFLDMLYALEHLHSRSLAHLDIKPDNIMMAHNGTYKLGDFGLLIDLNERAMVKELENHPSEGDAKYLAKEVLNGIYTCSADIFSLGITMLELAADLVLPISGPLWHVLRDGTYTSPYFKKIPFRLRNIIIKMMLPDFKRRPNIHEILNLNAVKKMITDRENRSFVNYYELYEAENASNYEVKPITVYLSRDNSQNSSLLEEGVNDSLNISTDEDMDNSANFDNDAGTSCHTPPKRVSQVILSTT